MRDFEEWKKQRNIKCYLADNIHNLEKGWREALKWYLSTAEECEKDCVTADDFKILYWHLKQVLMNELEIATVCRKCKGIGKVPERDYIGHCGYNDCPGEWYQKDMIQKKDLLHSHYIFLCPVCNDVHYREKLIDWPMIPCPDCKQSPVEDEIKK